MNGASAVTSIEMDLASDIRGYPTPDAEAYRTDPRHHVALAPLRISHGDVKARSPMGALGIVDRIEQDDRSSIVDQPATMTPPLFPATETRSSGCYRITIVIPVYRGASTLPALFEEIEPLTTPQTSVGGVAYVVHELLLVHDCGPDRSDLVIEALARRHACVRPVWLTRNYGQHAATLAGMSTSTGDWIVTIDEDGQQDPADIGTLLDAAVAGSLQLVYAEPSNTAPHGRLRNLFSRAAKMVASRVLGNRQIGRFNSFRLVDGEIARTLAAYCGNGVYLDVGLFWITGRIGHAPIALRKEMDRPSAYSYFKLLGHFWNLILTTGTRPLRLITLLGLASMVLASMIGAYALYGHFTGRIPVQGWASLLIVVAFFSGSILMALGVIAEYLAVTMGIVMGKPLYVVGKHPTSPFDR